MTANLLRSGDVVYLGQGDQWVRASSLSFASIASDKARTH
ncbi:MAG: DUF2849 domain-containing protein [Pseudomonadota bacterium]